MGVSFSYSSTAPVSDQVRGHVLAEAEAYNASHDWWCENFIFLDNPELQGHLVGDTKLFLPGYSLPTGGFVEVDPDDDSFMAYRDGMFILAVLTGWSRAHGITWEIEVMEPIGLITSEGPDASIQEFLAAIPSDAIEPSGTALAEERAARISTKYASRNNEGSA